MEIFHNRDDKGIEDITEGMKSEIFNNYFKAQTIDINIDKNKVTEQKSNKLSITQELLNNVANSNRDHKQRDYIKNTVYFEKDSALQKIRWF